MLLDVAWAITNDMLASVSLDSTLRLWQLRTGDAMKVIDVGKRLLCCALCPLNNNYVVVRVRVTCRLNNNYGVVRVRVTCSLNNNHVVLRACVSCPLRNGYVAARGCVSQLHRDRRGGLQYNCQYHLFHHHLLLPSCARPSA